MTCRSGSWLMMFATPVRSNAWSSTSITRAGVAGARASVAGIGAHRDRERRRLPGEHDFGTGAWSCDDGQRRPDPFRPFLHARHAKSTRTMLAGNAPPIV